MIINWQDVFYIMSSITMIAAFFALIWLIWLFFVTSRLIRNFAVKVQQWDHGVDEIRYLLSDAKLKVSKLLLKILNKRIENKKI